MTTPRDSQQAIPTSNPEPTPNPQPSYLLSKFPTGDYEGRHAEDDADSDDDEAVQQAADSATSP